MSRLINGCPLPDDQRLLSGPWQAFERDVGRILLGAGFEDVRIVEDRTIRVPIFWGSEVERSG